MQWDIIWRTFAHHLGVFWGSFGGHLGINCGSYGVYVCITWRSFGGHWVVIWASTGDHVGGNRGFRNDFSILFKKNVIQAHWTSGIFHEVGVANIPRELNQVFLATGFQMPVTEFFVKQYARAYEHWLQDGDPEKTKDFCYESKDLQNSYALHILKHGSKAMYKAHTQHVESLNVQPLPVGRVHEEID